MFDLEMVKRNFPCKFDGRNGAKKNSIKKNFGLRKFLVQDKVGLRKFLVQDKVGLRKIFGPRQSWT